MDYSETDRKKKRIIAVVVAASVVVVLIIILMFVLFLASKDYSAGAEDGEPINLANTGESDVKTSVGGNNSTSGILPAGFSELVQYNYGPEVTESPQNIVGYAAVIGDKGVVKVEGKVILCKYQIINASGVPIRIDAYGIIPETNTYSEYMVCEIPGSGDTSVNYLNANKLDGKTIPAFVGQTLHVLFKVDGNYTSGQPKTHITLDREKANLTIAGEGLTEITTYV